MFQLGLNRKEKIMKITESKFALTLFDDRCQVAVARKQRTGWLVTGYAVSWIEKGNSKNVLGISAPQFLQLKNIKQVRKLFNDIAQNPEP
jgi:hypothetical protein